MKYALEIFIVLILFLCSAVAIAQSGKTKNPYYSHTDNTPVKLTNAEWKKYLPGGVYTIAREKGTERAYTGALTNNHKKGNYYCTACGHLLFYSTAKFESGTGWPSFFQPAALNSVKQVKDADGYREEVECARCGSHLGHVFDDGPKPTGLRYCMNSAVLDFEESK